MTLEQLHQPVEKEFLLFREEYSRCTHSHIPLLHDVEEYLALIPGKQLRPLLLLLSAKACGQLSHKHILMATAMELLHNATLMHDDVVDESDTRRGHQSVRHRWGNQVAVLCGDYYLSQVMTLLQQVGESEVSGLVARTVAIMSQGELQQLDALTRNAVALDEYISIIGSKTASLMALCCELGAMLQTAFADNDYRKPLHNFGYHYGLVFQIRDDIHDTSNSTPDKKHDICIPDGIKPNSLIEKHSQMARQSLNLLPPSSARDTLDKLLHPSAPSPVN